NTFYVYFFFFSSGAHRALHSFPTRRSSDLWLTYSGSYWSSRHSALSQINRDNVGHLALRWIHQLEGASDCVEVSPVVRKGIMFVDRKSTRLNSSHVAISYAVFCLKKKKTPR